MDIISNAGGAGGFSFDDSSNPNSQPPTGRGRVRSDSFGLPERAGLIDLARTYLDVQARLWPTLVGTPAVPVAMPSTVESMADDFERRFRSQAVDPFQGTNVPKAWTDLGIAYLRFSDEGSNPRSLDQQLLNVLTRARHEGVFIPWLYVCADAAVSGTLACRRGHTVAKKLVERRVDTGVAWFFIDDLCRLSRNTIESLRVGELAEITGVRIVGASDGFDSTGQQSKIMLPMMSSFNELFIDQLRAKVRRGMNDAFLRGDNIQPPGVGYRMVPVTNPDGSLVFTHKGTVEKRVEIEPDAAEWTQRGAEMIAYEGKSAIDVARLFNEHKVGGKQTWTDGRVRQHYGRERLVGKDPYRMTKTVINPQTGKNKLLKLPRKDWLYRDVPHLRILSDELADAVKAKLNLGSDSFGRKAKGRNKVHRTELYPKVLIRPICGCCGAPMILGRSSGKYQSFFCFNATSGVRGCTNRGYKSARLIDEAVLNAVSATLFTDSFVAALTADVNAYLTAVARRPLASTRKLEQEIANRERQLARLTARLDKVGDERGIDAIFEKVAEMERELKAKREELVEQRRRNCRPSVKRVKEKDVTAMLAQVRDVLQGDIGRAAPMLKALVGDVVIESRAVDDDSQPRMFARFRIDAVPALAALGPAGSRSEHAVPQTVWGHYASDAEVRTAPGAADQPEVIVPLHYDRRAAARELRRKRRDDA